MKILTQKRLERLTSQYYTDGFRDAVESLVKAIESNDTVILGNNMSFVGMKCDAPLTTVGNNQNFMNGLFTMDPKYKKAGHKHMVTICGKL